jgi:gustatory receptor
MIPMTLEIFLPCYFGNELSVASTRLSEALFHSNWFKGDKKVTKTVNIFIENTKRDIKIAAFGAFQVNLANFSKIINSAYSLFSVLKK